MKVIYDLSVLGEPSEDYRRPPLVCRAVEALACTLAESPGIELVLSAARNLAACVAYRATCLGLDSVALAQVECGASLPAVLGRLRAQLRISDFGFRISDLGTRKARKIDPTPPGAEIRNPKSEIRNRPRVVLGGLNAQLRSGAAGQRRDLTMRLLRTGLTQLERRMGPSPAWLESLAEPIDAAILECADIFHSTFHGLPPQVRRAPSVQRFVTVHDVIPIFYPHFFGFEADLFLKRVLATVGPEDWVLCPSTSVRDDLLEYRPLDPDRVFVTHWGADRTRFYRCHDAERRRAIRQRYGIPDGPYLLVPDTRQPQENTDHLVRCFIRLCEQEKLDDLHLVLVGELRSGAHSAQRTAHSPGPSVTAMRRALCAVRSTARIVRVEEVAAEDLAPLYSEAMAFVYPALFDGSGLPVLEAMQCGAPVVASDRGAVPEVAGDAALLLDPSDADALCQALMEIYHSPWTREAMSVRSLARAAEFSWERCAAETMAAYGMAVSGSKCPPVETDGCTGAKSACADWG